jgi:hypothetical protein
MRVLTLLTLLLALTLAPATFGAQQRSQFDHLTTGFELTGQHRDLPCEECHASAIFKGTPRDCAACHGIGSSVRATAKSANHILSTEQCDSCHATVAWVPAVNFDHAQTHGSCSTCHNNVQAQGKGPRHISTNLECSVCHSTLSWSGALFNHEGISGGCAQCHNGVTATGLPSGHIPTGTAACESCHSPSNFTTFAGAVMDHNAVAGMPCANCHEAGRTFIGVTITTRPGPPHPATGDCSTCHSSTSSFTGLSQLPPNHLPTSQPCSQCHSNPADFSIFTMSHQGITSGCANCHGAGLSFVNMAPPTLKEFPPNHIPTGALPCEGCHSTSNFTTFAGTAMNHTAVTAISCSTCHEAGRSFVGSPAVVIRPPAPHVAMGECSNCHFSTITFKGASGMLPANHIPLPAADGANCALCHTNSNDFSIYTMNHNGIGNNCAQCHGAGLSFANIGPPALKEPPTGLPAHIPTGNAACELCHAPTNFTTFAGTTIKHAAVAGKPCVTCHELGMSWYGISNLWVRPGQNHHRGQDCGGSGCHSPRDRGGGGGGNAVATAKVKAAVSAPAAASVRAGAAGVVTGRISAPRGSAGAVVESLGAAAGSHILGTGNNGAIVGGPGTTTGGLGAVTGGHAAITGGPAAATGAFGGAPGGLGTPGRGLDTAGPRLGGTSRLAPRPAIANPGTSFGPSNHPDTAGARCATCHRLGMSRVHAATTTSCESCHTTLAWLPVTRVDHQQVKGPCASCHNGTIATGMSHRHVAVTRACDGCHTTNAWTPARFDHVAAAQRPCTTCHDRVHASGLPRNHIPTPKQCDACHGTLAWTPVKLDHSILTTGCAACHNNAGAVGKPASHMTTARECTTCHAYPDWNAINFRHATTLYPGQHHAVLNCDQCHTANSERVVYAAPAEAGTCGGCHAKNFKADAHPKTVKGQLYSASELTDCTGACHVYSDSTGGTITKGVRGPYHRVTDATFRH